MAGAASLGPLLTAVSERARAAAVFEEVAVRGGRLECKARGAAAPASYRLESEGGRLWVSLVMADRWLSESIEADLMHTGDKLEELIEEELVELGCTAPKVQFEHFRSEDKLFTFRSLVDAVVPSLGGGAGDGALRDAGAALLLAYEACFRNLGDMSVGEGA